MLRFSPPDSSRSTGTGLAARTPSPTLAALALSSLIQLFPKASPAFLKWAVAHHLSSASHGPPMGVEEVVARVGEKVLDGLGELYPHTRLEEREDAEERDRETLRVQSLNRDLLRLAQLFPSHPIPFLRSVLAHPTHEPAPLHLATLALTNPNLSADFGPPPALLAHPAKRTMLDPSDRLRSREYKIAVLSWMENQYPSVGKSSLRGIGAENNWDWRRTVEAVDRLVDDRSLASRVWADITSSLKAFASTTTKKSKGKGRALMPWEGSSEFVGELCEKERLQAFADDEEAARRFNKEEYERWCEEVECACCFGDGTWEEMGACSEGHLICRDCINTHVSVLCPSLTFTDDQSGGGSSPSSTLVPCPSCPSPPATACTASIELPTLKRHLTPANWANYDKAIQEALARSLQLARRSTADEEILSCPFCPYTTVRCVRYPTAQAFSWYSWSHLAVLLVPMVMLLVILALAGEGAGGILLSPWLAPPVGRPTTCPQLVETTGRAAGYVKRLVARMTHRRSGATLRCRNASCGRQSCLSCQEEVWDGEPECSCLSLRPKSVVKGENEGEKVGDEEKEKEELRLVIERAMTEAAVRTCPKCELGFMKSDSCNKMTCPRDNYKMCYVCRADVSVEGYSHFCPHFRVIPGPCTECNLCDLYILPDEDTVITQAGEKVRRDWLRKKEGAGQDGQAGDRCWVDGMQVGPINAANRRAREAALVEDARLGKMATDLIRLVDTYGVPPGNLYYRLLRCILLILVYAICLAGGLFFAPLLFLSWIMVNVQYALSPPL